VKKQILISLAASLLSGGVVFFSLKNHTPEMAKSTAGIAVPAPLGTLRSPNGGVVDVYEVARLPSDVYCVIAVSTTTSTGTLYPVLSCLKR